jgi:hypothetical protein
MRGAVPPLPNTPSWRGAQFKTGTGTILPLHTHTHTHTHIYIYILGEEYDSKVESVIYMEAHTQFFAFFFLKVLNSCTMRKNSKFSISTLSSVSDYFVTESTLGCAISTHNAVCFFLIQTAEEDSGQCYSCLWVCGYGFIFVTRWRDVIIIVIVIIIINRVG